MKHHLAVKSKLHSKGSSFAKIARQLGVSRATVTIVSQGMRRSRRIEVAIAKEIGTKPAVIWPTRYAISTLIAARKHPKNKSVPVSIP